MKMKEKIGRERQENNNQYCLYEEEAVNFKS